MEDNREAIENEFKQKVSEIFKEKIPGVTYDEESGFITIPAEAVKEIREKRRSKK